MSQETLKPETRAVVESFKGDRSKKRLKVSIEATAHQKEAYRVMRERMARGEDPVFWVYIGAPLPIMQAMDLQFINSVNFGAVCSAKQMSQYYLDRLNKDGYFRDLCRYCTVPLGYAFDKKPEIAPWGGLPKFTGIVTSHQDDPAMKIFEIYAREFNVPMYFIDLPYYTKIPDYQNGFGSWDYSNLEKHRVDVIQEEYNGLIRFLETLTGRHFSNSRLTYIQDMLNQCQEWYGKATNLAGETVPCPISWPDALSLVSAGFSTDFQFMVDLAKHYYEEIKERVDQGLGACNPEKVRLRYWGHPVWFSLGFYNTWEEKYGACFLPCYYFEGSEYNVLPDQTDPIRAQAVAWARGQGVFRIPCSNLVDWHLHISRRYKVDGVVFMLVESCKLLYATVKFGREACEKAGFPTLEINADMVDARDWDDTKMKSLVASFIETITP